MKGGAGLWKSRPVPTLTMNEMQYTFVRSTGGYEAGKTYTLPRKIGRWQVRYGNAVVATSADVAKSDDKPTPRKKKVSKKKTVRKERASAEPEREQAMGDE